MKHYWIIYTIELVLFISIIVIKVYIKPLNAAKTSRIITIVDKATSTAFLSLAAINMISVMLAMR